MSSAKIDLIHRLGLIHRLDLIQKSLVSGKEEFKSMPVCKCIEHLPFKHELIADIFKKKEKEREYYISKRQNERKYVFWS